MQVQVKSETYTHAYKAQMFKTLSHKTRVIYLIGIFQLSIKIIDYINSSRPFVYVKIENICCISQAVGYTFQYFVVCRTHFNL